MDGHAQRAVWGGGDKPGGGSWRGMGRGGGGAGEWARRCSFCTIGRTANGRVPWLARWGQRYMWQGNRVVVGAGFALAAPWRRRMAGGPWTLALHSTHQLVPPCLANQALAWTTATDVPRPGPTCLPALQGAGAAADADADIPSIDDDDDKPKASASAAGGGGGDDDVPDISELELKEEADEVRCCVLCCAALALSCAVLGCAVLCGVLGWAEGCKHHLTLGSWRRRADEVNACAVCRAVLCCALVLHWAALCGVPG